LVNDCDADFERSQPGGALPTAASLLMGLVLFAPLDIAIARSARHHPDNVDPIKWLQIHQCGTGIKVPDPDTDGGAAIF
jgi:hypothetical protein